MKYVFGIIIIWLVFTGLFNSTSSPSEENNSIYENNSERSEQYYEGEEYYDEEDYYNDSSLENNDYDCTEDCSGHEAGYDWASDHGIDNPDDCDGNSDSFIEGCMSYAEENMEYYDEEDSYTDEDYYYEY